MSPFFLLQPEDDSAGRGLILEADSPREAMLAAVDGQLWGFSESDSPMAVHEVVLTTRFALVRDRGEVRVLQLAVDKPRAHRSITTQEGDRG